MVFILSVGYIIEYIKGNRSLGFVATLLSIGFLSVIVGTIFFIRYPLTSYVRYTTFVGFYLMYAYTLMSATTSVTFTFVFPLAMLFCMYIDRWFMSIVCSLILILNAVYIIGKFKMVDREDIGEVAYNQFTTTMMIHGFVLLLFMSSLLAVVYVFYLLKRTMDFKVQETIEARIVERKLFFQATIDELTGLFNRRHFLNQVQEQLDELNSNSALLLLDIDDFKQINDTYGHIAGDQVLIGFSLLLKNACAANRSIVGRIGGEEFAVFLTKVSEEEAQQVAERVRSMIGTSKIPVNDQKQTIVTVSGGLAFVTRDGMKFEELYQRADIALYISKRNGKNTITVGEA